MSGIIKITVKFSEGKLSKKKKKFKKKKQQQIFKNHRFSKIFPIFSKIALLLFFLYLFQNLFIAFFEKRCIAVIATLSAFFFETNYYTFRVNYYTFRVELLHF